jgi:hypothetical protein
MADLVLENRYIEVGARAAVVLAAAALRARSACGDDTGGGCSCNCNRVCRSTAEGHAGCTYTWIGGLCSPSGCCDDCCDN